MTHRHVHTAALFATILGGITLFCFVNDPRRVLAYDFVVSSPLSAEPGGAPIGRAESATASTLTFHDATHATATFRSGAAEIRGEVTLLDGSTDIVSHQRIVLGGSPFYVEAAPGVSLRLVDGLRQEVSLEQSWPIQGLDATTTRWQVTTEVPARPQRLALRSDVPCESVHLWPAPRVEGPVLRTDPHTPLVSLQAARAPGWSEVWVERSGIWLRGYTWEATHCRPMGGISGTIGQRISLATGSPEQRSFPAHAEIAASPTAAWTVRFRDVMRVVVERREAHTFYRFPIDAGGTAFIEGLVRP